jgi:hypothetical protein
MNKTTTKIKLTTTLKLLKEANPCESGLQTLIQSLPKKHSDTKPINLLHILESNGIDHFFWAWRATQKPEKKTKRMILHDIVESVQHVYEKKYPTSSVIKNVLKALKTGKGLKEASRAADAAAYASANAADAAYAADAAAYASSAYAAANASAYAARAADAADATYIADLANSSGRQKQTKIIKKYLE